MRRRRRPAGGREAALHLVANRPDGTIDVPSLPIAVTVKGEVLRDVLALKHHAEKFGPVGVKEVAAVRGLDLSARQVRAVAAVAAEKPKRQRRSSKQLREQVAELHGRGMVRGAIADVLNISDRRAKELLAELDLPSAA